MATESGRITSAREPILTIRLADDVTVECVVDTGFTGALMLPREIIERSSVPIIGKKRFNLSPDILSSPASRSSRSTGSVSDESSAP